MWIAYVRVFMLCFRILSLSSWQYWYDKRVSHVMCYLIILFSPSFSSDLWLFDQMSYSVYVRTFYVVFCTLSLVFRHYLYEYSVLLFRMFVSVNIVPLYNILGLIFLANVTNNIDNIIDNTKINLETRNFCVYDIVGKYFLWNYLYYT